MEDLLTHCVLIAIAQKELHLNASLYTLLQILSVPIFDKAHILYALQRDTTETVVPPPNNQMILFAL